MNNDAKALKSGFWYLIANFVVKAMALITTPIFTRLLTKNQFGGYSNWFSWTSIAVIIITMSMESSLISAKFDYRNRLNQYGLSIISLILLITTVWAVIINVFSFFFSELLGMRILYVNLTLIYCFFYAVVNIFQISERYQYKYKSAVFVSLLVAVSTAVVSILLVLNMKNALTGRIIGTVLPLIVIGGVLATQFVKTGKKIDFSAWPYALKICLPFVPHLLSLTILNSVDRIMITNICGAADNAMYSVAYTCGHMITILITSMNNAFSPWLGDKLHSEGYDEIKKVSKYYIMVFCALAIFLMLLAPEILLIIGGRSYMEAKFVLAPVSMGCVCQFLYTLFVNIEQYKKRTVGMAVASVLAAALNYILNFIFIPMYGYVAAAYTTLVGYLFLLLMHMWLVSKIGLAKAYNYSFVITITIIMLGISVGVNALYYNITMRLITLGIFLATGAVILLKERTRCIKIVKIVFKR